MAHYRKQERGTEADYERYLESMDASMQQKVALTAAHLLGRGNLADMGMGSGTGSEALAALYPKLLVTGVDINPEMVKYAKEQYQRKNLDFRAGDIGAVCFPEQSLDVVFNSSVLHHVTTFNDYEPRAAQQAIVNQVFQLKTGGNLIIRDFLRPQASLVHLELPEATAQLFRKFSKEFRFLRPEPKRGFSYRELGFSQDGWAIFETMSQFAVEFLLRKDYREDWKTEILEEYTYFTQLEFERVFQSMGLRLLASTPLRNPWIVRNRFEGKFRLKDTEGSQLPYPATNYLIVGEKVETGKGVDFVTSHEVEPGQFLSLSHYQHRESWKILDLVRRPNTTLDVIPYFFLEAELYIVARRSYPRPLLKLCDNRLDEALSPCYVTEPVVLIQGDKPMAQTVEEELQRRVALSPEKLLRFHEGSISYPSPGGLQEELRPIFVEIEATEMSSALETVRAISARQLLRAAQVGGLPDARLELHAFELLLKLHEKPGQWIGESIKLSEQTGFQLPKLQLIEDRTPRRKFQKTIQSSNFLNLNRRLFLEKSSSGETLKEIELEYVVPKKLSHNTVAVAPLCRMNSKTYLGLFDDDLPAAQCFSGHSDILVAPAWRCPVNISNDLELERFAVARLEHQHGLQVKQTFTLGGSYFPSPGATPEIVYPLACEVEPKAISTSDSLKWITLDDFITLFPKLRDGHLKILGARAARALGYC